MKLIALVNVKYGQKQNAKGETVVLAAAPGEPFDMPDTETAKTLIANGSAATPDDYERAKAAAVPAGQRIADLEIDNAAKAARIVELEAELAKGKK